MDRLSLFQKITISTLKKTKNRQGFTLLEILICLTLIGLMSALFGFQGKRFLDEQRFNSSLQLLSGECEKAKFLSLVYRTDIDLEIVRKKSGFFLWRKCDEPGLPNAETSSLPGIQDMRYQGKKTKKIVFAKFSSGHAVEHLPIEFLTSKGIWKTFQPQEFVCNSRAALSATDKKSQ